MSIIRWAVPDENKVQEMPTMPTSIYQLIRVEKKLHTLSKSILEIMYVSYDELYETPVRTSSLAGLWKGFLIHHY